MTSGAPQDVEPPGTAMLVQARVFAKYRVRIEGLAGKLKARCRTRAYLVKQEDIQEVIDLLAEFIEYVDSELAALDSTRGGAIRHLQAHRRLAREIRNRCFSMIEYYRTRRRRAKPPEFYDWLSALPQQLYDLANRLPEA